MASIASVSPTPTIQRAFERSISPHSGVQIPSCNYVVVWEWETKPHRWRPYSPVVTQLLERAHTKKINKIFLKDADPLLYEYYIDMTNFEQICEPTSETYPVRREYYAHTSPAAKGAKWEWASHALTGSNGSNSSNEWHIYDMEVQTVIEEAWALGEQTIDIGNHFPGCPYIINFCNLTQVRRTTGVARPIRRQPCASYPMVKLTAAEIASMLHRKEERRQEFAAEVEKRIKEIKNKKHIKAKKAVKHLMNHLFHPAKKPLNSPIKTSNGMISNNPASNGFLLPPRKTIIGHPNSSAASSVSEAAFPAAAVIGRRRNYPSSASSHQQLNQPSHYKRFHDYASFSSFSDTSSHHIVRRPSVDTISTYLSSQYRYGGSSRTASSYYAGGSFGGSQDLIDMYGHETDSVFTDEEDHISFQSRRYEEPAWPHGLSKRVLSDPAIHQENNDDLYVNLKDNLSLHSRQNSLATSHHNLMRSSQQSLMKSHNSLSMTRSPQRGATVHDSAPSTPQKQLLHPFPPPPVAVLPQNSMNNNIHDDTTSSTCSSPSKNGTLRKRPVPTPRTILNTVVPSSASSSEMIASKSYHKIDKLIRKHAQFVIDPNGPDDYCPVCNKQLDEPSDLVHIETDNSDLASVVCLTNCLHKVHLACLKWSTPDMALCLKCPTCASVSGCLYGDMPTTGASMTYKVIPKGISGYEDYHAIQITYNMSSGIQDKRHPYPGSPFYAIGFPKIAFLPDTELGRHVLKLLEKAFNQQLTFTLTTQRGSNDAMVTWNNSIGHKTEFGPVITGSSSSDHQTGSKHSYPDPAYLEDVARQLSRLGITTEITDEEDDDEVTNV